MTAQELINLALRDLGELPGGETPNAEESADALSTLNQILGSWSLDRRAVYTRSVQTFALTQNVNAYTMGVGGSWNTAARPVKIIGALAIVSGFQQGLEVLPMEIFSAQIANGQGITAALPSKMGVDAAAPNLNVRVFPTPNVLGSIEVQSWQALAEFATLATEVTFPVPGYELALRTELAVTLAPSYGRPVSADLAGNLQRFLTRMAEVNAGLVASPAPSS